MPGCPRVSITQSMGVITFAGSRLFPDGGRLPPGIASASKCLCLNPCRKNLPAES